MKIKYALTKHATTEKSLFLGSRIVPVNALYFHNKGFFARVLISSTILEPILLVSRVKKGAFSID